MSLVYIAGYVAWLAPTLLQAFILVRALRLRLRDEFPAFYHYIYFQVARTCVLFPLYLLGFYLSTRVPSGYARYQTVPYFFVYWPLEVVDAFLMIAVIHEVYAASFLRYEALRRLGRLLFNWAAAVMVMLGFLVAVASPGADSDRLMNGVLAIDEGFVFAACGLIALLFFIGSHFQLRWNRHAFGITLGLALYLFLYLGLLVVRRQHGLPFNDAYAVLKQVSYNCTIGIWVFSFFARDRISSVCTELNGGEIYRWNEALAEMLRS